MRIQPGLVNSSKNTSKNTDWPSCAAAPNTYVPWAPQGGSRGRTIDSRVNAERTRAHSDWAQIRNDGCQQLMSGPCGREHRTVQITEGQGAVVKVVKVMPRARGELDMWMGMGPLHAVSTVLPTACEAITTTTSCIRLVEEEWQWQSSVPSPHVANTDSLTTGAAQAIASSCQVVALQWSNDGQGFAVILQQEPSESWLLVVHPDIHQVNALKWCLEVQGICGARKVGSLDDCCWLPGDDSLVVVDSLGTISVTDRRARLRPLKLVSLAGLTVTLKSQLAMPHTLLLSAAGLSEHPPGDAAGGSYRIRCSSEESRDEDSSLVIIYDGGRALMQCHMIPFDPQEDADLDSQPPVQKCRQPAKGRHLKHKPALAKLHVNVLDQPATQTAQAVEESTARQCQVSLEDVPGPPDVSPLASAGCKTDPEEVGRLLQGDEAFLHGDIAAAAVHYQGAQAYGALHMTSLYLASGQLPQAVEAFRCLAAYTLEVQQSPTRAHLPLILLIHSACSHLGEAIRYACMEKEQHQDVTYPAPWHWTRCLVSVFKSDQFLPGGHESLLSIANTSRLQLSWQHLHVLEPDREWLTAIAVGLDLLMGYTLVNEEPLPPGKHQGHQNVKTTIARAVDAGMQRWAQCGRWQLAVSLGLQCSQALEAAGDKDTRDAVVKSVYQLLVNHLRLPSSCTVGQATQVLIDVNMWSRELPYAERTELQTQVLESLMKLLTLRMSVLPVLPFPTTSANPPELQPINSCFSGDPSSWTSLGQLQSGTQSSLPDTDEADILLLTKALLTAMYHPLAALTRDQPQWLTSTWTMQAYEAFDHAPDNEIDKPLFAASPELTSIAQAPVKALTKLICMLFYYHTREMLLAACSKDELVDSSSLPVYVSDSSVMVNCPSHSVTGQVGEPLRVTGVAIDAAIQLLGVDSLHPTAQVQLQILRLCLNAPPLTVSQRTSLTEVLALRGGLAPRLQRLFQEVVSRTHDLQGQPSSSPDLQLDLFENPAFDVELTATLVPGKLMSYKTYLTKVASLLTAWLTASPLPADLEQLGLVGTAVQATVDKGSSAGATPMESSISHCFIHPLTMCPECTEVSVQHALVSLLVPGDAAGRCWLCEHLTAYQDEQLMSCLRMTLHTDQRPRGENPWRVPASGLGFLGEQEWLELEGIELQTGTQAPLIKDEEGSRSEGGAPRRRSLDDFFIHPRSLTRRHLSSSALRAPQLNNTAKDEQCSAAGTSAPRGDWCLEYSTPVDEPPPESVVLASSYSAADEVVATVVACGPCPLSTSKDAAAEVRKTSGFSTQLTKLLAWLAVPTCCGGQAVDPFQVSLSGPLAEGKEEDGMVRKQIDLQMVKLEGGCKRDSATIEARLGQAPQREGEGCRATVFARHPFLGGKEPVKAETFQSRSCAVLSSCCPSSPERSPSRTDGRVVKSKAPLITRIWRRLSPKKASKSERAKNCIPRDPAVDRGHPKALPQPPELLTEPLLAFQDGPDCGASGDRAAGKEADEVFASPRQRQIAIHATAWQGRDEEISSQCSADQSSCSLSTLDPCEEGRYQVLSPLQAAMFPAGGAPQGQCAQAPQQAAPVSLFEHPENLDLLPECRSPRVSSRILGRSQCLSRLPSVLPEDASIYLEAPPQDPVPPDAPNCWARTGGDQCQVTANPPLPSAMPFFRSTSGTSMMSSCIDESCFGDPSDSAVHVCGSLTRDLTTSSSLTTSTDTFLTILEGVGAGDLSPTRSLSTKKQDALQHLKGWRKQQKRVGMQRLQLLGRGHGHEVQIQAQDPADELPLLGQHRRRQAALSHLKHGSKRHHPLSSWAMATGATAGKRPQHLSPAGMRNECGALRHLHESPSAAKPGALGSEQVAGLCQPVRLLRHRTEEPGESSCGPPLLETSCFFWHNPLAERQGIKLQLQGADEQDLTRGSHLKVPCQQYEKWPPARPEVSHAYGGSFTTVPAPIPEVLVQPSPLQSTRLKTELLLQHLKRDTRTNTFGAPRQHQQRSCTPQPIILTSAPVSQLACLPMAKTPGPAALSTVKPTAVPISGGDLPVLLPGHSNVPFDRAIYDDGDHGSRVTLSNDNVDLDTDVLGTAYSCAGDSDMDGWSEIQGTCTEEGKDKLKNMKNWIQLQPTTTKDKSLRDACCNTTEVVVARTRSEACHAPSSGPSSPTRSSAGKCNGAGVTINVQQELGGKKKRMIQPATGSEHCWLGQGKTTSLCQCEPFPSSLVHPDTIIPPAVESTSAGHTGGRSLVPIVQEPHTKLNQIPTFSIEATTAPSATAQEVTGGRAAELPEGDRQTPCTIVYPDKEEGNPGHSNSLSKGEVASQPTAQGPASAPTVGFPNTTGSSQTQSLAPIIELQLLPSPAVCAVPIALAGSSGSQLLVRILPGPQLPTQAGVKYADPSPGPLESDQHQVGDPLDDRVVSPRAPTGKVSTAVQVTPGSLTGSPGAGGSSHHRQGPQEGPEVCATCRTQGARVKGQGSWENGPHSLPQESILLKANPPRASCSRQRSQLHATQSGLVDPSSPVFNSSPCGTLPPGQQASREVCALELAQLILGAYDHQTGHLKGDPPLPDALLQQQSAVYSGIISRGVPALVAPAWHGTRLDKGAKSFMEVAPLAPVDVAQMTMIQGGYPTDTPWPGTQAGPAVGMPEVVHELQHECSSSSSEERQHSTATHEFQCDASLLSDEVQHIMETGKQYLGGPAFSEPLIPSHGPGHMAGSSPGTRIESLGPHSHETSTRHHTSNNSGCTDQKLVEIGQSLGDNTGRRQGQRLPDRPTHINQAGYPAAPVNPRRDAAEEIPAQPCVLDSPQAALSAALDRASRARQAARQALAQKRAVNQARLQSDLAGVMQMFADVDQLAMEVHRDTQQAKRELKEIQAQQALKGNRVQRKAKTSTK